MQTDLTGIDVSHLDALAKLEADQRAIRALSEKARLRRDREVELCTRVMGDYAARVAALQDQADVVRQKVRDDLDKLEALYQHAADALNEARGQLQEHEFRHEIGEFTHEEFQRNQEAAERTIAEREVEFESVGKLRGRYLELLGADAPAERPQSVAPVVKAQPVPHSPGSEAATAAFEAPDPSTADRTNFVRPPSPADFRVPSRDQASAPDSFGTIAVSPAMLIEDRSGLPGTHHRLGPLTTIGRASDNQIMVPLESVSRKHARILIADGAYVVQDLGSPNGTMVNGEPITGQHRLKNGDKITLGEKTFTFKAK